MADTRRLRQLADSAARRLSLPDGDLVVGLSGGADSAALAWLCVYLEKPTRALHVNHGLEHSDALEAAARSIATGVGVDLMVVGVTVGEGASPEGRARAARYRAFETSTRAGETLLTAHTLDDDAETVLLNLLRGAGPRGLSGIPRRRSGSIARPALELRRSETREIASLAGLAFLDDPMNEDTALTRNWLRRVIIPQLEEANPRLAESLHRTGRLVGLDISHLDRLAAGLVPRLEGSMARQARGVLLTAPEQIASRALARMLEHVLGASGVTYERLERMWSVLRGESARQEIASGVVVELEGPMLVLRPAGREPESVDVVLTPGSHRVGAFEFEVRGSDGPCQVVPLSKWTAIFPAGAELVARADGVVTADGQEAWVPGERRLPVAWYQPGARGYLSVTAREGAGWTSSR